MTSILDVSALEAKENNLDLNVHSQTHLHETKTKVYKYRWVILGLFMVATGINGFQWIQYSIISNVVQQYYGVKSVYVDWLSIIFMFAYIPITFPSFWLIDKKGLRLAIILGSVLNCLAAWIKVVSVRPDLFYVTFIGQTIGGIAQVFTLNTPSRLAAVWFSQKQVSTACSIAVFGNQVGVAMGFLLPPVIVQPHDDIDEIGANLSTMFYIIAGLCTVQLVLVILFFRDAPKLPPSPGQATRATETSGFLDSLKRLARNPGYVMLVFAYGISLGVFNAISTLLNQMVLTYFPGHEEDAGRIGLTIMVAGMCGSVVSGIILDKTHKFKETTLALYVFSLLAMVTFTFCLANVPLGVIFGIAALLGFFMTGYLPVGYEFAAEITYPEPEGTTAGMLNLSMQVFGIILTLGASALLNAVGAFWSNFALSATLVLGTILTGLIKADLRRQAGHKSGEDKINLS